MNPSLQIPDQGMTLEELSDFVGQQMKRLNIVLKSIDGLNIVDIKFDLKGGAYLQFNRKGLVFNDGNKNTFTVGVDGKVTLTGALVQAVEGAYPNVQLDGAGNIFQASKSATEYIAIDPDYVGSPTQRFVSPNAEGFISAANLLTALWLNVTNGNLILQSQSGTIFMYPGDFVKFEDWTKIKGATNTLQQELDSKQDAITSGDVTVISGVATLGNNINTTHLADGSVSNTEFQYINSLTSNVQNQLNEKISTTGGKFCQEDSTTITIVTPNVAVSQFITFPFPYASGVVPKVFTQVTDMPVNNATYLNLIAYGANNTGFYLFAIGGTAQTISYNWESRG